jgi:hypothetical protein
MTHVASGQPSCLGEIATRYPKLICRTWLAPRHGRRRVDLTTPTDAYTAVDAHHLPSTG